MPLEEPFQYLAPQFSVFAPNYLAGFKHCRDLCYLGFRYWLKFAQQIKKGSNRGFRKPRFDPSLLRLARLLGLQDHRRINMRKMVLAFFRQVLRVSYPVTGLAGTRCLIVPQFTVQCLYELDTFTQ